MHISSLDKVSLMLNNIRHIITHLQRQKLSIGASESARGNQLLSNSAKSHDIFGQHCNQNKRYIGSACFEQNREQRTKGPEVLINESIIERVK